MTETPILIVGAGPTGLVLALWLTRLGVAVRIIDKAVEPATSSRALGVQARTLEFYRQLGISDGLIDAGVKASGLNLWVKGAKAARVPFGAVGEGMSPFPYLLIAPQDVHERWLIAQLSSLGVNVERRTELTGFNQTPDRVFATLARADGSSEVCEAHYLAGCDGARSIVRETLGIGFPGGTYTQLFYVADVAATGRAIDDEVHVDLDEADLLAVFPMKGGGRARLIGTVRDEAGGLAATLTFADVSERAMRQLEIAPTRVNWFSTYHVHHRVADVFRKGRAFLLGDAAHIHSPAGGQGMNTGIGDAVNLAWKLAAVLNGRAPDPLLDTYEQERIRFARRLVATTDRGFTFATRRGGIAKRVRTRLVPILAPPLLSFRPLRRFIFRTISQTGINYRLSTLSAGRAGRMRGGDRLPWIRTAPNDDNFVPLSSLRWQVHVYGEPALGVEATCRKLGLRLHSFPWQPEMRHSGLTQGSLFLVRPDGYVALAQNPPDVEELVRYFSSRDLRLPPISVN